MKFQIQKTNITWNSFRRDWILGVSEFFPRSVLPHPARGDGHKEAEGLLFSRCHFFYS